MTKELRSRHRAMMESIVLDGKTQREVALGFGITESRLSILCKSPLWKIEERELREEYRKSHRSRIEALVPKALDALEGALDGGSVSNQIAAARELLSRGGVSATVNVEVGDDLSPRGMQESYVEIQKAKAGLLEELGMTEQEFLESSHGLESTDSPWDGE